MKLLQIGGAVALLSASVTTQASQLPTDQQLISLCVAVANDDVPGFNIAVTDMTSVVMQISRNDILNYVMSPDNFACNGYDLKNFASQRNASQIANHLGFDLFAESLQIAQTH